MFWPFFITMCTPRLCRTLCSEFPFHFTLHQAYIHLWSFPHWWRHVQLLSSCWLLWLNIFFKWLFTHSPLLENRWAAGRGGNCPSCRVAELQELHPCLLSRDTGRSQHAPPSGLTTTQRPSDGVQESQREKTEYREWKKHQEVEREERRRIRQRG